MGIRLAKLAALTLAAALMTVALAQASGAPRMSIDELKSRLGESGLVIVDVRLGGDWSGSEVMVKGAIRGTPNDIAAWSESIAKDQTIVLYCS